MSKERRSSETSDEWRARIMSETEGMTKPGEILAHLAADQKRNGIPSPDRRHYTEKPPAGATFDHCPLDGQEVDDGDPCEGCPGYGPECGALWREPK